jgi:small-conductance mechanosensitive channel
MTATNAAMATGALTATSVAKIERAVAWLQGNGLDVLIHVGVAVALYVLLVAVRGLLRRLAGRPDDHPLHSWREIVARILARTRSFFLAALAVELVTLGLDAPPGWVGLVEAVVTAAVVIQAAIWVRELVLAIIERRSASADAENVQLSSAMGVIRLIVNVAIWAVAVIVILDNMGVNVTALVAGLGIGGIAIGLAAQGIFSDLFAALSILFDKPFVKGDTITVDTLTGTVEKIGLKTTRVRALSGEVVSVSNARLLENRIHNHAQYNRRRVVMAVGIIYQTPPDVLEALPQEIEKIIATCKLASFDRAHIVNFGASSIDLEIVFHVESAELGDMMDTRHKVMIGIVRRFAELDVDFAYPTQTGFLAGLDGKPVDPLAVPRELQPAP